jgi:H+-transporting ATPase
MTVVRATDTYTDVHDALAEWHVDPQRGLDESEVPTRRAQYGPNEIHEKEEPTWHRIFRRFWGPIPWMIEIAAILSALVRRWEDFAIITITLLVNAGIDLAQERRALGAVKALEAQLALQANVLRSGV